MRIKVQVGGILQPPQILEDVRHVIMEDDRGPVVVIVQHGDLTYIVDRDDPKFEPLLLSIGESEVNGRTKDSLHRRGNSVLQGRES